MLVYIVKRVLYIFPVMLIVSIIVFSLIHMIPGDPVIAMLGIYAKPEIVEFLRGELNLDKPIIVQYMFWLRDILRGDFGISIRSKEPVFELILSRVGATLILAVTSLMFSVIISIIAGVIAAKKRNTIFDFCAMFFAILGISIPAFWLGIMVISVFSLYLGIFPSMGYVSFLKSPIEAIHSLILPAGSLGFGLAGFTTRMTRSQMLEVLNQDFIRTARSKGLKEYVIIFKHALKNASIPIITAIGIQFAYLMGGTILIEQIFAWPGIGRLAMISIINKDYPVVQGVVLFSAVIFVIVNVIVDIIYTYLNPKIKLK